MFLSFLILVLNVKPREVMLFGSKPLLRVRQVFSKPIEVARSFCTKNEDPNFLVKAYIGEKIGNETFFESFVCRHFLCLAKCTNPHFDVYHEKMEILIQLQKCLARDYCMFYIWKSEKRTRNIKGATSIFKVATLFPIVDTRPKSLADTV